MTDRFRGARAQVAPGRFLWIALLAAGCQTIGGPRTGVENGPPPVVVERGGVSAADEAAARGLMASAEASFEARRYFEAARTTRELVERYPASEVSGRALRLQAIALFEAGATDEANADAERYIALLPAGDPRAVELRIRQAEAATGAEERLGRILSIQASLDDPEQATLLLRSAADSLDVDALERVVSEAPDGSVLAPAAQARLAVSMLEEGREDAARSMAQRALEGGASGLEQAWAEGVLREELPPGRGRVTTFTIGAVLPSTGPPALAGYAASVREGIELAVETVLGDDFTVTLEVRDDEGDPELGARQVAELEAGGAVGIVGFLLDDVLLYAGPARSRPIPIMSPTARTAGQAGEAVFSLEEADPDAAESIAEYGARRAYQRVAMVYPNNPAARAEADAFEARAEALGMPVVGRFEYEPGATFFEAQIMGARDALRAEEIRALNLSEDDTLRMEMLVPAAVFMPLPPEDVELLAPQVVHFGLDTLAIEVLGTSGWTDAPTLASVDARLTDGVVATMPSGVTPADEGPRTFREAYERRYQKSLVSTAPAVGYDATLLMLEALRRGRVEPEELRRELHALEDVHGATGIFHVRDGRVLRRTEVIRIDEGRPVPIDEPPREPDSR